MSDALQSDWRRRLAMAGWVILVALFAISEAGATSEAWRYLIASSTLVVGLAIVVAWLGRPMLGPVFHAEMLRAGRSDRPHLPRVLVIVGTLFILGLVVRGHDASWHSNVNDPEAYWKYQAEKIAELIDRFLHRFTYLQLLAVWLLTPAYLGGALAEEREGGRLEALFLSGLSGWDIVGGKLCAGIMRLGSILFAAFPIIAFAVFLGDDGIAMLLLGSLPRGALGFFEAPHLSRFLIDCLVIAGSVLSLAALTMLCSACCRKARDAILLTYLLSAVFLGLTYLVDHVVPAPRRNRPLPIPAAVTKVVCRGNPIFALRDNDGVKPLPFAAFHGLATLLCLGGATVALRPGRERRRQTASPRWRPTPGPDALLWKEIVVDQDRGFWRLGSAVTLLAIVVCFVPVMRIGWIVYAHHGEPGYFHYTPQNAWLLADIWCRVFITVFASLALLRVGLHAAGSFSGERERGTLEPLLTTPVDLRRLLLAKWLGSLASARGSWLWLLGLWGLSMICGGTHWRILGIFLFAWLFYAACFASLGVWLSVHCRNTRRATLTTLGTLAVLCLGHWLSWFFLDPNEHRAESNRGRTWSPAAWLATQMYGLTPPVALGWIALRGEALFLSEGEEYRADVGIVRWKDCLNALQTPPPPPLHSGGFHADLVPLVSSVVGIVVGGLVWLAIGGIFWLAALDCHGWPKDLQWRLRPWRSLTASPASPAPRVAADSPARSGCLPPPEPLPQAG